MRLADLGLEDMSAAATGLSVAVTTYNRWDRVRGALQSVLDQRPRPLQIILVDDCSPDPIPEELRSWMVEVGVNYIRHHQNQGLAAARNTAVKAAKAEYFSFCDDDDRWAPGFVAQLTELLMQHPDTSAVALYPASGKSMPRSTALSLKALFVEGYTPPVGAQAYRRDLINQVGGYDSRVRSGVDHDLWVQLLPVNPRFAIGFGDFVMVDDNPRSDRMTTRELERRSAIVESLDLWRPIITRALGTDFFEHFEKSYTYHLDAKFFRQACTRRDFLEVATRVIQYPNVRKYLINRLADRLNPRFTPQTFMPYVR